MLSSYDDVVLLLAEELSEEGMTDDQALAEAEAGVERLGSRGVLLGTPASLLAKYARMETPSARDKAARSRTSYEAAIARAPRIAAAAAASGRPLTGPCEGLQSQARRGELDARHEGAFDLLGTYDVPHSPEKISEERRRHREGAIAHAATVLREECGIGAAEARGHIRGLLARGLSVEELEGLAGEDGEALLRRLGLSRRSAL